MINYPNQSIPVFIGEVVTAVSSELLADLQDYDPTITGVNYIYGNIMEVTQQLSELWQSYSAGQQVNPYPLFVLIEDITIDRRNTNGFFGVPNMSMFIANVTKQEYKSWQRESINFEPILRPLYHSFLKQLVKNKYVSIGSERKVQHTMSEKKFWGVDGNTATALQTNIDAITIDNLQFNLSWEWCTSPVTDIL